ncbi:MAG: hypothetical protein J6Q84_04490 [Kiritimatiellae bacterium]|nr:hypothetical protein [Kiritimatiellia bacterium]
MSITIKCQLTDDKGVAKTHTLSLDLPKEVGGVSSVIIPGVVKFTFTTDEYNFTEPSFHYVFGHLSLVWFYPDHIKNVRGGGKTKEIHTDTSGYSDTYEYDLRFSDGRNVYLWSRNGTAVTGVLSRTWETIVSVDINAEFKPWTVLPVRKDGTEPMLLYRSPSNNLILRDGDG